MLDRDVIELRKHLLQAIEALTRSISSAEERLAREEFFAYRQEVADVIARIQGQILNPLYANHPHLDDLR